jgi:hypothetical protein
LTNEVTRAVAAITDAELDRIIWEARLVQPRIAGSAASAGLKARLATSVRELISTQWRPMLFPSGKFPEESFRFFNEPTETLYTLALAYPHLDTNLQAAVSERVAHWFSASGPFAVGVGQRTYPFDAGEVRSAYEPPPENLLRIENGVLQSDLARLYLLWLWAQTAGDWRHIERNWANFRKLVEQTPNKMEEDCRNGYLTGLIALCRLAHRFTDAETKQAGVEVARRALRERLTFEFAHTRGGLIWQVPKLRSVCSRWHFLTPEVGRLLALHVGPVHRQLMERYVDYHRPVWWLAWNVETMMRNECPYEFPTLSAEVFAARSLILTEPTERLAAFLDRPWFKADEYCIQKLALALDAASRAEWMDLRNAK